MSMHNLKRQLCASVKSALSGDPPMVPVAGHMLWRVFHGISAVRTYHPSGPNPIQPTEVEAWCRLARVPLQPRHIDIIFAMDAEWLRQAYARTKAPEGVKALPPISKQPLSAGLLDAIMG